MIVTVTQPAGLPFAAAGGGAAGWRRFPKSSSSIAPSASSSPSLVLRDHPAGATNRVNRKTLDIDPAVSALLAKIEKLKIGNQLTRGEVVTETGIHKAFDADELRDILIRERDRILAAKAHLQGHGKGQWDVSGKAGHTPQNQRARGP